jgi:hypothetical protein
MLVVLVLEVEAVVVLEVEAVVYLEVQSVHVAEGSLKTVVA